MSVPSGNGSDEQRPINLEDDSDSSMATLDDNEPLMEQVDDTDATPMDEAAAITELKPDARGPPPHVVSGEYEWVVRNFSGLHDAEKEWSERFEVAGSKWRLLLFPRGNRAKFGESMSVYLDCPDLDQEEPGWTLRTEFHITLVHPDDKEKSIHKQATHSFHKSEADWGFADYLPLTELKNNVRGFVREDDSLHFKVSVEVDTLQSSCYDSRKETGYVGLRNQGATCYLNSWLQTLFNINCFREAVFHIPTTEQDEPTNSIPLALQTLFYQLQFGGRAVSTNDLTKSFGWDSTCNFMQEDVHEFNKVLMEALETKMKGTKVEGVINKLFEGRILKFIECLNVDYKSTKRDDYMDIFLDVKGCKNVYESFDRLTAEERLEGDNQYNAEGHGMQDAKIGDLFCDFPPVLQLHLKRFEYDLEREMRVKINDRYEFEEVLDLDVGDRKYLSKDSDTAKQNKYKLHSVLVHSGGTHGGHYYAYSRPDGQTWLRFDDEKVTREEARAAIDEQFGGDNTTSPTPGFNNMMGPRLSKLSSAYMLLYIREEEWDAVMCDVPETAVALHLRQRLQAEEAERARLKREKEEAHRYTFIRVATIADMKAQVGSDAFFDLVDVSKVKSFRVRNEVLLSQFREQLAEEMGVPRKQQRLWFWEQRANDTLRPCSPVPPQAEQQQVKVVRAGPAKPNKQHGNELLLFLDNVETGSTAVKAGEEVLVFIKHYDPRTSKLTLVSRLLLHPSTMLGRLADRLADRLHLPPDRTKLLEEVKALPVAWLDALPLKEPLSRMQPQHGDIIVVQEQLSPDEAQSVQHPTVMDYLSYIQNRRIAIFKRLAEPKEEGIRLELLASADYLEIVSALATKLQLSSPDRLRLTQHNAWAGGPSKQHVKWKEDTSLERVLRSTAGNPPVVYYEVLDMPLEQLEQMTDVEVALHNAKTEEVGRFQLRLHRDMVVADVLRLLRERAGSAWEGKPLRLLRLQDSEIYKACEEGDSIADPNSYWQLAAHEVPADEAAAAAAAAAPAADGRQQQGEQQQQQQQEGEPGPPAHLIRIRHVLPPDSKDDKSPLTPRSLVAFGVPFVMAVSPTETMADVADRMQKRLCIPNEQFAAWRFKFVPDMSSRTEYLEDDDLVIAKFLRRSGDFSQTSDSGYLALEHLDTGPKRQKRPAPRDSFFERAMKIG